MLLSLCPYFSKTEPNPARVPASNNRLLPSAAMVKIQACVHRLLVSCSLHVLVAVAPEEPELGTDNTVHWSASDKISPDNMLVAKVKLR